MEFAHFMHEAKSKDAYLYDKNTVHIRLRVKKGLTNNIKIIYGDPFLYKANEDTNRYAWAPFEDGKPMIKRGTTPHHDVYFTEAKPKHLRMKYAFLVDDRFLYGPREVVDLKQDSAYRYNLFNYFNFPFLNEEDLFTPPAWAKNQIWYAIFPERFANGNQAINAPGTNEWDSVDDFTNQDLFGGDLPGLIDQLDYIEDMGFTGIYLTPIFKAMSTHKYDTTDYFEIDPAFGTKEDLKTLVDKAHQKGIKVMLDAVFNHVGLEHPFFLDVLKKGKDSPYYDCFYIIDEDKPLLPVDTDQLKTMSYHEVKALFKDLDHLNYRTFAFTPFMPKVKTMHPAMQAYFLDVATYWIKHFDIDGWRLDVSNEIPHAFWRAFRDAVKAEKQDAYIVGENWDDSMPWLLGDQYDAVMNYEILFPIWQFFGPHPDFKPLSKHDFIERINQALFTYPDHINEAMYNLVDSHDTARIKHICGQSEAKVKMAYAFMYAFPGSPSVYYGDEIGMSGGHDPKNRQCMNWDKTNQALDIQAFFKRLNQIRKTEKAMRSTWFHWLDVDDDRVLMFQKDTLLFIMNHQAKTTAINLPKPFHHAKDLLSEKTYQQTTLSLKAYDLLILKQT